MSVKWVAIFVVILFVVSAAVAYGAYNYGHTVGLTQAQDTRARFLQDRGGAGGAFPGGAAAGATGAGGTRGTGAGGMGNFAGGQIKTVNGVDLEISTATEVMKVKLTDATQIQKTTNGTPADLQPGETIVVQGDRGADGVITARSIQIGRGGMGAMPGAPAQGQSGQQGQQGQGRQQGQQGQTKQP